LVQKIWTPLHVEDMRLQIAKNAKSCGMFGHQVQCGDSATEKKIEEKIDHFLSWVEKYPNKKSRVCHQETSP
jgi:hypothetical protein